jgi:ferredoxin
MRVIADRDACAGHARCAALCPEVFDIGDDGKVVLLMTSIPQDLRTATARAVANCPDRALGIES